MAAAGYYQPGGPSLVPPRPSMPMSQQPSSSYLGVPPPPQRASSQPNVNITAPPQQSWQPQPASYSPGPPPPPYEPLSESAPKPTVHFAPTPRPLQNHPRPNSFSGGQRPNVQHWAPPPFQQAQNPQLYPPQQQYTPQGYQPQQQALVYQNNYSQPPQAGASHLRPYDPNISSSDLSSGPGYSSDPERHRRRRKHRHHDHKNHSRSRSNGGSGSSQKRRTSDTSRSANADGFIGAAGGGLIGDLIFPGLGTVGGALAGWIGGRGYGERRKDREDRRDRSQYAWEERFGKPHPGEERDPYYSNRYHEKDGYERRRSHEDRDRDRKREKY